LDRIPAHRSSTPYSIPNTRAIHVFYPNAAAAHALNPGTNPHCESPSSVASIDGRALSSRRTASKRSKDEARSASDYVPLWNASTTTVSSAAAPQLASWLCCPPINPTQPPSARQSIPFLSP
jgi:hypothetical protein